MTATPTRSLQGVIPWLALFIVAIFALSQVSKRGQAESRAAQAASDLQAIEGERVLEAVRALKGPAPGHAQEAPAITPRERALDDELGEAREALKEVRASLVRAETERDGERTRADRLSALHSTEQSRAAFLEKRMVAVAEQVQKAADERVDEVGVEAAKLAAAVARAEERLLAAQDAHQQDVEGLTRRVAELGSAKAAAMAQAMQLEAQLSSEQAQAAVKITQLEAQREEICAAHQQDLRRVVTQLEGLHGRVQRNAALLATVPDLERRRALDRRARETAEKSLRALRRRLQIAARLQLAAADAPNLCTGVRIVGLLKLEGYAPRLLELTDHEDAGVRAIAAGELARVADLARVKADAMRVWPLLLADEALAVRLAGVALAEAVVGAKIAFAPGASPKVRAEALARLVKKHGS